MNTLFKKEELVSAVDIEGNIVKLAQIKLKDNKCLLCTLAAVTAASSSPEDLAKSIYSLNSRFKLQNSLVVVNMPRHMATVRDLKMPSVSPIELEGMVSLQAPKLLPYPKEEIIHSYKVTETTEDGYSAVMLVLTHRGVVEKILKPFTQNGIDVHKIALGTEALFLWFQSKQIAIDKDLPLALIDIDSISSDMQIVRNNKIEFTRGITFTAEDKLNRLVDEIKRSFLTYKKEHKLEVAKLLLTGAETILNEEAPVLKKELNLHTVYVNMLNKVPLEKEAKIPAEEDRKKICFTTVLALAFNFDKLELNMLPSVIRKARAAKLTKETILITGLLLVSVVLGLGGIIWKKMSDKYDYLKYLNAEIKISAPRVEELNVMLYNIKVIKNELDMRGTGIDIVRELYKLIPSNMALTIFDFEERKSCTLRGTADELSGVFKFITTLENSDYFKNVKVRYATKRLVNKQIFTDFEIICQLD